MNRPLRLGRADREFVMEAAVEGDVLCSGLAFLILDEALSGGSVSRSEVIERYVARLRTDRGMNALITMSNLESIVAPKVRVPLEKRYTIRRTVQANAAVAQFTEAEVGLAESLLGAQRAEEDVLLTELLATKSDASRSAWAGECLRIIEARSSPQAKELAAIIRRLVQERRDVRSERLGP